LYIPLSRASLLLQSGGLLILSIHDQEGISVFRSLLCSPIHFVISTSRKSAIHVDDMSMVQEWNLILHDSRERIRKMVAEEEKSFTHQRIDSAFVIQNYPFNFERSLLSLDTSSAIIRLSSEKGRVHRCTGVSLTPSERAFLSARSIVWRECLVPLTLTPSSLLWNESLHSSDPSSLSRRLVSTISPFVPPSSPLP
ncbi:hypothetical protein PMAYCL1PPCAC_23711, partial [Pristionchus mayeri]